MWLKSICRSVGWDYRTIVDNIIIVMSHEYYNTTNNQQLNCSFNGWLKRTTKKTLKLRFTDIFVRKIAGGGFPSQRANAVESVTLHAPAGIDSFDK